MGWTKMRHKTKPEIRYWMSHVYRNEDGVEVMDIRATKNASYDSMEKPPERCLPGGAFPLEAVQRFYEPV